MGAPGAGAGHRRRAAAHLGRPAAGAVLRLVRVLPALRGRGGRPARRARSRHGTFATAAQRLPGRRGDGLRRRLPAADPPDRPGQPQGPQQRAGRPAATTSARRGRSARPRAATTRSTPSWARSTTSGAFVAAARDAGLEVALDLALQCAPDHPWVTEHPEWFTTLPDGTIAYAENPPKKYQDIYPLNFDNDPEGIRAEILRVVLHWVEQGVKIFRVDNPHTKPIDFWHWLIWQVKEVDPDVLFLAEAFTRPAIMHGLGTIGFTQSYTYFTWRTTARRAARVLRGAGRRGRPHAAQLLAQHARTSCTSTLQHGGPAMFKIRAVLASLLSPSWGIYAGYELYEHVARPGRRGVPGQREVPAAAARLGGGRAGRRVAGAVPRPAQRDPPRQPGPALAAQPALPRRRQRRRCCAGPSATPTPATPCWWSARSTPRNAHWANTTLDMPALGFDWHERFTVRDELTGAEFDWGQHNAVRLDPYGEPAHVFTVQPRPEAQRR